MRTIILAGGSGFLGESLADYFSSKGDSVIVLSRSVPRYLEKSKNISFVAWDARSAGQWIDKLESADALINLTGKNVNCRYTESNKKEILESRIRSTALIGESLRMLKDPPKVWINASSATIYNASSTTFMTEDSNDIGDDFSMSVCKHWEHVFNNYRIPGVRKIAARIGIVIGKKGGAFLPLRNLAMIGFGGRQGDGYQYCSWIHVRDFCAAIDHLIMSPGSKGVYNISSPDPVTNQVFMKYLRKGCNIAVGIPLPKTLLEIGAVFIGTETELILKSRKVFPKRLLDEGFVFEFDEAKKALINLCRKEVKKSLSNIL